MRASEQAWYVWDSERGPRLFAGGEGKAGGVLAQELYNYAEGGAAADSADCAGRCEDVNLFPGMEHSLVVVELRALLERRICLTRPGWCP